MRIISGQWGGRRIQPPANMPHTRPTTDIAKEGLFNIIDNNLEYDSLKTLDLFGGTGAISYELASRGVNELTIVEKDPKMAEFISDTSKKLGIENLHLVKQEVFAFLNRCTDQYNLIFAGPPYALVEIDELPLLIFSRNILAENGWFILEHTPRNDYKKFAGYRTERKYGTTIFSIFINKSDK